MFVFPTPNKVTVLFIHLNVRLVGSPSYLSMYPLLCLTFNKYSINICYIDLLNYPHHSFHWESYKCIQYLEVKKSMLMQAGFWAQRYSQEGNSICKVGKYEKVHSIQRTTISWYNWSAQGQGRRRYDEGISSPDLSYFNSPQVMPWTMTPNVLIIVFPSNQCMGSRVQYKS